MKAMWATGLLLAGIAGAGDIKDASLVGDRNGWRLEFETLQERIHPAASRVDKLAVETPAGFVAFDLLALGDESFMDRPLSERRAALAEKLG